MADLINPIFTDRFIKPSDSLTGEANLNRRAWLLVGGVVALASAIIGKQQFKMDTMTAEILGTSGSMMALSALTERDGPLCLLLIAACVGTGYGMIKAIRDDRLIVHIDLVELLKFGYEVCTSKKR